MRTESSLPLIIEDVESCLDADVPAWIWGAPGIGKSDIIRQIAARRRKAQLDALSLRLSDGDKITLAEIAGANPAMIDIRLSSFDPTDLRGLPFPDLDKRVTDWLRAKIWPAPNAFGLETIIFFDELDRAATAVANAALQIVLDRQIGDFTFPDTVRIVAAGNGSTDRGTTTKIGTAQANRFAHFYAIADAAAAAAHWARIGIDPALVAFIRFRGAPDLVNNKPGLIQTAPAPDEHAFGSPRSWARCHKFMHLPDAQRARQIAANVGSAPALECEAFIRMFRNLPSIAAILRDPRGAPVPSDLNVLFATSGALSKAAGDNAGRDFAAVCDYAQRMPREFEIVTVTDAVRRFPTLANQRCYAEFCARNQDVTL